MILASARRLVKRLTPAIVGLLLYNRLRGFWVAGVKLMAGFPLLGRLARHVLLIDQVSLREAVGNASYGVSDFILEPTPAPVHFPSSRHAAAIEAMSRFFAGTRIKLNGHPAADGSSLLQLRMVPATEPSPGLMYLPPQRYHCTLQAPYLNLERGGSLCSANGFMVMDYLPLHRTGLSLQKNGLYGRKKPQRAPLLEGRFTSVWGRWAHVNYYHWLIDCLPQLARLGEIDSSPPLTLLMPESMPAAWEDSLACCLPAGMTVHRASGWVRPERFVLISTGHPGWGPWLASPEREFIRTRVFERFGLDAERIPTRRIFISRSSAAMRRLINEGEVASALGAHGFETVRLEGLSFEQQVRLFHDAAFIAGTHGAAFANLLFAGRAKVLELFAGDAFKPLYFFLSRSLGLEHEFLLGSRENRLEDFSIETGELQRTVERMMGRN